MQGIEEASRMKEDAADRLAGYEEKLEHVDDEIERVKREMKEAGEAERVRVLEEAREKRERLERDARLLIEQELKAARELLLRETVATAVRSAADTLSKQVSAEDHERLAKEYLAALDRIEITARGGSA
jgi:F-type H+-transporting ATPase subunit b